ncbi:ABC transporter permease/M1 family aminopeptidase [Silvibacterium sp.]|uniref:ABC transporter permease/M1 family aminopeptidase n=1 Tax=Silvibacterium sp. TaxID=1964179 RepID=UPI0039E2AD6E
MFLDFLLFELRLRLKSLSTYVYFAIFFLLAFLCIAAEDFGPAGAGKIMLNSPYATWIIFAEFPAFGIIVMSAIFGTSILRDFQRDTYQMVFTKPISKIAYLGGRWLGSLLITLAIFISLPLGEIAGCFAPWADHTRIAPIHLGMMAKLFFSFTAIQVFFVGAIFFMVAALTRKIITVYLQGVVFFVVYLILAISVDQTRSLNVYWPSVFDPLGMLLTGNVTRYWTVAERNSLIPAWTGMFLWNRVLWISVGLLSLAATWIFFPMSAEALTARASHKKKKTEQEAARPPRRLFTVALPAVHPLFSARTTLLQFTSLVRLRIRNVVREIPFWAITLVMIVYIMINGHFAGRLEESNVWPVTYLMLGAVEGSAMLFFLIVSTLYAGELIWRERDVRFELIHDALPSREWIDWISKFCSLAIVELILLTVVMFCGMLSQAVQGYFHFEPLQYFKELYLITFAQIIIYALLAFFVQTVIGNKFLGHGIVVGFFILVPVLYRVGVESRLVLYGEITPYTYSDMNGYGHFVAALTWSLVYWLSIGGLLGVIAVLLHRRGSDLAWRARLHAASQRLPGLIPISIVLAIIAIGSGSWFYYNTHVLNVFRTAKQQRHLQAEYEKLYKKYEKQPLPKIIAVDTNVNIYPQQRSFSATGWYDLENRSAQPISDIHISGDKESIVEVHFNRPSTQTLNDRRHWYWIYHLATPLAPGERMRMFFTCAYTSHGFKDGNERAEFAYNGTFFDADYFPYLGYNRGVELDNPVRRREEGLGKYEEMAPRGDAYYSELNLFRPDSDWVTYHTVVSTSGDQIAISPGYLQKKWTADNRNYFEYSMGSTQIQDFFSYLSGRYTVKQDRWNNVNLEVYYDPAHPYDLDKMIGASKSGLDYYSKYYSPYQFAQYRILEYPRYREFAQSFPNTVPYSEGMGFIGRVLKPEDIDFTWFVTAHELAHQWWGHQLIGGDVQGSNMMSESLAEYSALRIMEHKYGDAQMRRFLRHELDAYLRGRAGEVRHEPPLVLVQDEPYVWYRKGSLVLYALSDYIGEDKLNDALGQYLRDNRYAKSPYPDTRGFTAALRGATPPELQYLITDMFETITLYDNRVVSANWQETADHKYKVTMKVQSHKFRANGDGVEQEVPVHDLIEVGVFSGEKDHEQPIRVEKQWLSGASNTITFIVDQKPTRAGIDPYNKLIDRNPEDNMTDTSKL